MSVAIAGANVLVTGASSGIGAALAPLLAALRVWDRRTARQVTHFTAISRRRNK